MINEILLNYRLTRLIGKGGMASVYEAIHIKLGTKVAVKVLDQSLTNNSAIRLRFENEAKTMAGLTHPNIIRVLDYDDNGKSLAIIMEYLEGEDIGKLIKRKGRLTDHEIKSIFTQVLKGIGYAHDKGIIHRDIKPSNIFIEPDGQVKVLDFGIAKIIENAGVDITQTGSLMGTPVYMSPEQVTAEKDIDKRTDLYSLGVTLYFMTRAKAPYDSATTSIFSIQTKIVNEQLPGLIPADQWDKVIARATQKKKTDRFSSCTDMLPFFSAHDEDKTMVFDSISPVNRYNDQSSTKPVQKKNNGWLIVGILTLIALAVVLVITQQSQKNNTKDESSAAQNYTETDSMVPVENLIDSSANVPEPNKERIDQTEKHRNLFTAFHKTSANQYVADAISYYADHVNFNGKYMSRESIGDEFRKTFEKYSPAGTEIRSFKKSSQYENIYDYELDYSLYVNGSGDPGTYKRFRIIGVVEFDGNDKISRIRDLSTVQY